MKVANSFDEDVKWALELLGNCYEGHNVTLDHKDCRDIKEIIEQLQRNIESWKLAVQEERQKVDDMVTADECDGTFQNELDDANGKVKDFMAKLFDSSVEKDKLKEQLQAARTDAITAIMERDALAERIRILYATEDKSHRDYREQVREVILLYKDSEHPINEIINTMLTNIEQLRESVKERKQ